MKTPLNTCHMIWKTNSSLFWLLITCLLITQACISNPLVPGNTTAITLERKACFWMCPVYTLVLHGDGRVDYEGYANVEIMGKRSTVVNPVQIHALIYELGKIDFFSLEERYTQGITDVPTFTMTFSLGNKQKRIEYDVCLPQALIDLEYKLDEIANSAQWIGQYSYLRQPLLNCAELFLPQPISPLR